MPQLLISEVARRAGVRPSAIRYYEQIGILAPAQRIGNQRRYDTTVLERLAVIRWARETGFTLDEVRQLFFGFGRSMPASERWKKLSRKKIAELDAMVEHIQTMQRLLRALEKNCHCLALEQCGKGFLRSAEGGTKVRCR